MRDDVKAKVKQDTLIEVRVKGSPEVKFGDVQMRQAFYSDAYCCWFIKVGCCRALSCRNLESFEFHPYDIVKDVKTAVILIE